MLEPTRDFRPKAFSDPAGNGVPINAHATNPLTNGDCDAVYITTAGDLVCRFVDGGSDVTIAVQQYAVLPFRLSHVRATSTADGLALYI